MTQVENTQVDARISDITTSSPSILLYFVSVTSIGFSPNISSSTTVAHSILAPSTTAASRPVSQVVQHGTRHDGTSRPIHVVEKRKRHNNSLQTMRPIREALKAGLSTQFRK